MKYRLYYAKLPVAPTQASWVIVKAAGADFWFYNGLYPDESIDGWNSIDPREGWMTEEDFEHFHEEYFEYGSLEELQLNHIEIFL